jgi:hypothetical protein
MRRSGTGLAAKRELAAANPKEPAERTIWGGYQRRMAAQMPDCRGLHKSESLVSYPVLTIAFPVQATTFHLNDEDISTHGEYPSHDKRHVAQDFGHFDGCNALLRAGPARQRPE